MATGFYPYAVVPSDGNDYSATTTVTIVMTYDDLAAAKEHAATWDRRHRAIYGNNRGGFRVIGWNRYGSHIRGNELDATPDA